MTTRGAQVRGGVVFEAADPPRTGRLVFWGDELPAGEPGEVKVVAPMAELVTVPAVRVAVGAALPVLLGVGDRAGASWSVAGAFWGAAARTALALVTRGRIVPGVSPAGYDAWRAGPLDAADVEHLGLLAAAVPPEARAVPLPGRTPLELPDALGLLQSFLDAVADTMPRSPAAVHAAGTSPFAAVAPQGVEHLRTWADELALGVRISLRIEADERQSFRAVLQVHDGALVADAGSQARVDTALAVRRAARIWPPLERLLHDAVPDRLDLGDDDVTDLLAGAALRLNAAGVDVHWPKDLVGRVRAAAVIEAPESDVPGLFGGEELLAFNWRLALGEDPLTEDELDRLAEATRPVVRLRDQWLLVDPELIRKARERELTPLSSLAALGAALSGTVEVGGERVEVRASGWLDALRERIADPEHGKPIAQPSQLNGTLRDYQLRGLRWLARMTSLGLGGCLADDMGLGKTITLIALHLHRNGGPTLVVCPASLLGNWEREIQRFAPGTPVTRFHGSARSLADGGVVLTTYGTMRVDAAKLAAHRWGLVVADEAQHVKNRFSSTARALRTIPAAARVALSGTPVENNLSELWSILDWTTPGLLGTAGEFRRRWADPIEADRDPVVAEELARLVRPFLLRRHKSDPGIAPELPPKTETDQPVGLTHEQVALYEAVVRETLEQIRTASDMARRGLVIKLLTALKQICNHPAQYLKEARPRLAGRSGKLELLDELVGTILAEDGAVLVFTQYVTMAKLLERHLRERGIASQLLHGGTPVPAREEMVRRFQDGDVPVFLLSLKAAGTGLNLTRADHVIHYDRWWNPAVEAQATDRAYRIGQTRPVQVHRMIAEGTIEDRIAEMLRSKRELADAVLGAGDAALTELSDAELADLVELRSGR